MIIEKIVEEFKKIKEVKAIVLAGSKAAKTNDVKSDFDLYIYSDKAILLSKRQAIAENFACKFEMNNRFFETGDEWILKNNEGIIDIMYRNTSWIESQIQRVYYKHCASVGYSTCFLYNVKNSEVFYDTDNWFKNLQEQIQEYPESLVENIIKKNLPLLKNKMVASFYEQTETAIQREDLISVNHRISAFLASYFDILFAVNKLWHPGEKRLLNFALKNCKILPNDFEKNINELLNSKPENKLKILYPLNADISKVVEQLTSNTP